MEMDVRNPANVVEGTQATGLWYDHHYTYWQVLMCLVADTTVRP